MCLAQMFDYILTAVQHNFRLSFLFNFTYYFILTFHIFHLLQPRTIQLKFPLPELQLQDD